MSGNITKQQNMIIHALLAQMEISEQKANIVSGSTGGRTGSSSELSYWEASDLIKSLKGQKRAMLGKMQGKVISYLKLCGYVKANGQEDLERINAFVANIGTNNPRKKGVWDLRKSELLAVLNQVETRYKNALRPKQAE